NNSLSDMPSPSATLGAGSTGFIDINQHVIFYRHAIPTGFTDVNQHAICYQHAIPLGYARGRLYGIYRRQPTCNFLPTLSSIRDLTNNK
ncbi:MAG: hypothetical protein LBK18_01520, partial [Prevotellaceae bacterium]|nr:hypothetical protein [Prevotellaceae bacterium]